MNADSPNFNNLCQQAGQPYQLPNGLSVFHVNKHETDFLYKEIFAERLYLKHGITLESTACVFDIGANIGLFSLFVKTECAAARIHAFEPIPELNRILKLNMSRYGQSVMVYENGVSDTEGDAVFTYYPGYSILSGLHADVTKDGKVLASGIRQLLAESHAKLVDVPDEHINRLVQKKLGTKTEIKCQAENCFRNYSRS